MNFVVLPPEAPAATDAIYQLLAVLADRAKTKAALAAARNEAQAAAEKLGDLQIERAAAPLFRGSQHEHLLHHRPFDQDDRRIRRSASGVSRRFRGRREIIGAFTHQSPV